MSSNSSSTLESEKSLKSLKGSGTENDPYIFEFCAKDGLNPKEYSAARRWTYTVIITMSVFAVTFTSAAYSSSQEYIEEDFHMSKELFAAGISLFVLGFAVGPALWAPLSELVGRKVLFVSTLAATTAFVGGTSGAKNVATILIFRFFAGMFGASTLTNAGATISDMFPAAVAGFPMAFFSAAPTLGPLCGPIVGGFVTITIGWRWLQGLCCIFIASCWILGSLVIPETYGPLILRREAAKLTELTGAHHISVIDRERGSPSARQAFQKCLFRPWVLLVREPIVLFISLYLSIIYATIYMSLPAFGIVYQEFRGWSPGIGGLAFLGLIVGAIVGLAYTITDEVFRFERLTSPTPEDRLPPACIGAIAIPIGLFGFAWTNAPGVHWSVSIILSAFFGFGLAPVFIVLINYIVESYTVYTASALAATAMTRSLIGSAFPLFTDQMFHNLGIHWAASIPAFLTVVCIPFPFVMYRYGPVVRERCKYSREAQEIVARMQSKA